jgi:hypothetical protein
MTKDTIVYQVVDTLSKRPEYGIVSSMLSVSMNPTQILQLIGIILGLFIAAITAVLKVIELRDKLKEKRINNRAKKKAAEK